jgi:hypothetical protein
LGDSFVSSTNSTLPGLSHAYVRYR